MYCLFFFQKVMESSPPVPPGAVDDGTHTPPRSPPSYEEASAIAVQAYGIQLNVPIVVTIPADDRYLVLIFKISAAGEFTANNVGLQKESHTVHFCGRVSCIHLFFAENSNWGMFFISYMMQN